MSICRNDGHHSPINPTFTFWPHYGDEENQEKRTVFFSYRARSTTATPARNVEGNKIKISPLNSNQLKIVSKGSKNLAEVLTPGISTTPTLTSSYRRPKDRPSALVSPLSSFERSRGNNVRVSHLRLNPATVGAPRALLKKTPPPPPLPPPPSPQPSPRQKLHLCLQPCELTSNKNATATTASHLQLPSSQNSKKSYTSSIHVRVSPIASPITLDLREPNTTSASTSNAIPQSPNSHPTIVRHQFASSHCPFNFRYKGMQYAEGVTLPDEKTAFTDTEAPLPSPRIIQQSFDERHGGVMPRTKECAVWKNTCDLLSNEATISQSRESVFPFPLGDCNDLKESKEIDNETANSNRLRIVSLRVGRACEIVRPFSSFHSLTSLEGLQKATFDYFTSTKMRAIDSTPRILFHDSVSEPMVYNSYKPPDPSSERHFDMPPDRVTTPGSPYLPDDNVCFQTLGNYSNAFLGESWTLPETAKQKVAVPPPMREVKLTPQETIERINKLRSILRIDEKFYPLQVDKCVQVEQRARNALTSCQASKECQVDQMSTDFWDTATISDTQSFNEHSAMNTNIVEDHGDCVPQPSFRNHPHPQENASYPLRMGREEPRVQNSSPKSVRRRCHTKLSNLKREDEEDTELISGAPFMTSRTVRSMSVGESQRLPPSEQGSFFAVNGSSSPISTKRWEECLNQVNARRRHHSASSNIHLRSSRPKRTSRKPCTTDRKKQQDLRCSLMRQTFASAQRCKASRPS
ncbi:unnamed protein product [Hydatigera taeniaeformis]|uniref:SH2 domain-containing protein n=1 Tax=Hydatigena taeniaeformis TaxID=6205 RepID=A0A0R3X6G7_HYDTA|nr:unnamed protein product [Hydatigera taeniaeformis]